MKLIIYRYKLYLRVKAHTHSHILQLFWGTQYHHTSDQWLQILQILGGHFRFKITQPFKGTREAFLFWYSETWVKISFIKNQNKQKIFKIYFNWIFLKYIQISISLAGFSLRIGSSLLLQINKMPTFLFCSFWCNNICVNKHLIMLSRFIYSSNPSLTTKSVVSFWLYDYVNCQLQY